MRFSFGFLALTATCALASPLSTTVAAGICDVSTDGCRAVMDGTACFNEVGAGSGSKASMLACLTGTDGTGTTTQKVSANTFSTESFAKISLQMCGGQCCVAPVLQTWITKNLACT